MFATIDVGSNTVRMLIGDCHDGVLVPHRYERRITRLGGDFSPSATLSPAGMERTAAALAAFAERLEREKIPCLRAVGTAALRRANNRQWFIDHIYRKTGLVIDVIAGEEEAGLTAAGVLSVVCPTPKHAVIFDIGGGSTEIIRIDHGQIAFQHSYPIGVVRLSEECSDARQRRQRIHETLSHFAPSVHVNGRHQPLQLIGTAGSMTTLAAIDLKLVTYDAALVNNHPLTVAWMKQLYQLLKPMTPAQRETLPGMEAGRGDLILPGIEVASYLAESLGAATITVADAGLLEGVFLDVYQD